MTNLQLALSPDGRWLAFILINVQGPTPNFGFATWNRRRPRPWPARRALNSRFGRPTRNSSGTFKAQVWNGASNRSRSPEVRPEPFAASPRHGDGATWNREGTILFSAGYSPVFRVPASGGDPQPVTQLDEKGGETSHSMPEFLPDGRHFLYWANNRDESKRAIWVGSLDSADRTLVMPSSQSMHRFAPPDLLLFNRDGKLLAQHLDLKRFRLTGVPVVVAEDISQLRPSVSASATGILAYYRSHFARGRCANWRGTAGTENGWRVSASPMLIWRSPCPQTTSWWPR